MSCKTRAQLETAVDTAFADLIDNTALACEQIDTEQKHDLWMMGGVITLAHSSGTNTLSWLGNTHTTVNPGSLGFDIYGEGIEITYPSEFYDSGVYRTLGITAQASVGLGFKGMHLTVKQDVNKLLVRLYKRVQDTLWINYNAASSAWSKVGDNTLANAVSTSYNSTPGTLTLTTTFDMDNIPSVTGYPTVVSGTMKAYTPFCKKVDANTVEINWWDNSAGVFVTGSVPNGLAFNIDFGSSEQRLDLENVDYGILADIYIMILGQKDDV